MKDGTSVAPGEVLISGLPVAFCCSFNTFSLMCPDFLISFGLSDLARHSTMDMASTVSILCPAYLAR